MVLHRALAEEEPLGDLLVRQSLDEQPKHLALPPGEHAGRPGDRDAGVRDAQRCAAGWRPRRRPAGRPARGRPPTPPGPRPPPAPGRRAGEQLGDRHPASGRPRTAAPRAANDRRAASRCGQRRRPRRRRPVDPFRQRTRRAAVRSTAARLSQPVVHAAGLRRRVGVRPRHLGQQREGRRVQHRRPRGPEGPAQDGGGQVDLAPDEVQPGQRQRPPARRTRCRPGGARPRLDPALTDAQVGQSHRRPGPQRPHPVVVEPQGRRRARPRPPATVRRRSGSRRSTSGRSPRPTGRWRRGRPRRRPSIHCCARRTSSVSSQQSSILQ